MITHTRLKQLLKYYPESGRFVWKVDKKNADAGDVAGYIHSLGYRNIKIDGRIYRAGRLAWFYINGVWPELIDHKNRIRDDDRYENLRECTHQQNAFNRQRKRTENLPVGINKRNSGRYGVAIRAGGKTYNMGTYGDIKQAVKVRDRMAKQLHGEFAYLNGGTNETK